MGICGLSLLVKFCGMHCVVGYVILDVSFIMELVIYLIFYFEGNGKNIIEWQSAEEDNNQDEPDENEMFIDSVASVRKVDFRTLRVDVAAKYEFVDLEVANSFDNLYAEMNGFGIKRHKVG